ncbi:rhamnulokinase [uncultured Bacteroides sp.]|uniref:rhamnulokinase n=1 Tax=uncultured Bacteroides sp. TaxID=162156 RepID=UPI002AAAB823|nr:rhamnulokinase [uncultured Bacteroides sp.]
MENKNFFAVDLGATSGRTILGTVKEGAIELRELTRFPNNIIEANGHFYWDIYALYQEILNGLKVVAKEKIEITSIGIDTWGVDFVCIGKDGEILRNPYSYRDTHTVGAPEEFFKKMPREKVYGLTGIQIMNFNSLFQLATIQKNNSSVLPITDKILFIPDALSYMLTGKMVTEYTFASTSQMLNPETKQFEPELLDAVGIKKELFNDIVYPGTLVGTLTESVKEQTGLGNIPVIAVAGHDTASAVAAVPAENKNFAYLSSGTWSLMGIESDKPIINKESFELNFTNEGGVEGTIRFLKNICGMWLLERCRKEWARDTDYSYTELIDAALAAPAFKCLINPDAPCFANPVSMIEAIKNYCVKTNQPVPETYGEITRCIFESLSLRYRQVLESLQKMATYPIEKLHVIGGGSKNNLLNSFTANALGIEVIAGPSEATAIGNVMLQAKAAGLVPDIQQMRELIRKSVAVSVFTPADKELWEGAYADFLKVYREDI